MSELYYICLTPFEKAACEGCPVSMGPSLGKAGDLRSIDPSMKAVTLTGWRDFFPRVTGP